MRRILNLNDVSTKFLTVIGLLVGGIPALLWLFSLLLRAARVSSGIILDLIKGSLILGGLLLVVFLLLIVLEQVQDLYLHRVYLKSRGKRIRSVDGQAECPFAATARCRTSKSVVRRAAKNWSEPGFPQGGRKWVFALVS